MYQVLMNKDVYINAIGFEPWT